jgi:hypothetical protein
MKGATPLSFLDECVLSASKFHLCLCSLHILLVSAGGLTSSSELVVACLRPTHRSRFDKKKGILAALLLPLVAALLLPNVPYHRQITEFSCGDATVEMLLHWSGMDVDQRAIIDVMRTSNYEGTLRWVRGAG